MWKIDRIYCATIMKLYVLYNITVVIVHVKKIHEKIKQIRSGEEGKKIKSHQIGFDKTLLQYRRGST